MQGLSFRSDLADKIALHCKGMVIYKAERAKPRVRGVRRQSYRRVDPVFRRQPLERFRAL
jgi:hypothetical protein